MCLLPDKKSILEIKSTINGYVALKGLSTSVFSYWTYCFPAPCPGCGNRSMAVWFQVYSTVHQAQPHLFRLVLFPPEWTSCQIYGTQLLYSTSHMITTVLYFKFLLNWVKVRTGPRLKTCALHHLLSIVCFQSWLMLRWKRLQPQASHWQGYFKVQNKPIGSAHLYK